VNTISDWEELLAARLPLYGHRNWIVIADAAYPAHSAPGIETVVAGVSQQAAIEAVLAQLCACTHVRPVVHLDRELEFVLEGDAPGIDSYRAWLRGALTSMRFLTPQSSLSFSAATGTRMRRRACARRSSMDEHCRAFERRIFFCNAVEKNGIAGALVLWPED